MFRRLFITVFVCSVPLVSCLAQSPASPSVTPNQSQTGSSATADPQAKSPSSKKIWTNENLAEAGGQVSVVGDKRNQNYAATATKPADPASVSRIRQNLQKLQSQLDDVSSQLSSFKEFQEGETVTKSSNEIQKGYTRMPINQQMAVLQDKKKKLEAQIDALFDEARKKGIDPGQLR